MSLDICPGKPTLRWIKSARQWADPSTGFGSRTTDLAWAKRHRPAPATGSRAFDPADPDGGGVATLLRPRAAKAAIDPNDRSSLAKVARNAPCPCGLGKKLTHCRGRV
jgi:hypothetical protein